MITIKTEEDLEKIRQACKIVARVLEKLKKSIKPGISTLEIDRIAEEFIKKSGALPAFLGYRGYKFSTCISINEQVVHGLPSDRKLKEGDIVGVDVGAIFDGYYGDNAKTFSVGAVGKKAKKLIAITEECLYLGIKQARDGAHLGDIGAAIQSHAEKHGFSVVRDLFGHGVGKNLHEDPLIPNFGKKGDGPELKSGMVLAIEPMLNIGRSDIETLEDNWTVVTKDREMSAHFEHTIAVTDGEPEILTKT